MYEANKSFSYGHSSSTGGEPAFQDEEGGLTDVHMDKAKLQDHTPSPPPSSTSYSDGGFQDSLALDQAISTAPDGRAFQRKNKRRRRMLCVALSISLKVIVVLSLLIWFQRRGTWSGRSNSDDQIAQSSGAANQEPSCLDDNSDEQRDSHKSRIEVLTDKLAKMGASRELMTDPNTPQGHAVLWLAELDVSLLDFKAFEDQYILERFVAVVLFFSTNGDGWNHQRHFLSAKYTCDWNNGEKGRQVEGIECTPQGTIHKLIFTLNDMSGPLPSELGLLEDLHSIYMSGNYISGELPAELGNLSNLHKLNLARNQLQGPIPASFGKLGKLSELLLCKYPLRKGFCACESQSVFVHYQRTVTTPVCALFYDYTKRCLITCLFSHSLDLRLHSCLPPSHSSVLYSAAPRWAALFHDSALHDNTDQNQLNGEIPAELSAATHLKTVMLEGNDLTGSADAAFCSPQNTINILYLDCASNDLTCTCSSHCCDSDGLHCKLN
uniref:Leucine-rich repeat-containing N-terminal plant-type domain-containing protein n=1 Tax=Craspedostauros australis TaxID=1486917 RepID=A0A7R9ZQM0_9STRA